MQSRSSLYAIGFTTVLSLVCTLALTGLSQALHDRQVRNEQLEEKVNVLAVLEVVTDPGALPAETVEAEYADHVEREERTVVLRVPGDGEPRERTRTIVVYTYKGDAVGQPRARAFVVDGMGLWGPMKGLVAVEPDPDARQQDAPMLRIRGVRFYQHQETPGLGGRIAEPDIMRRFRDKRIVGANGEPGIRITPEGEADEDNEIDGITGATLTCQNVQTFVTDDIQAFLEAMKPKQPQ